MDDDLRNRFRAPRRSYGASGLRRPVSPQTPSVPRKPTPVQAEWVKPKREPTPRPRPESTSLPQPQAAKRPPKPKKTRSAKKRFLVVCIFVLLLLAGAGGYIYIKKFRNAPVTPADKQEQAQNSSPETPKPTGVIRMIATGDNLAFESINNAAKTANGYDYAPMMSNFKPLFEKADIRLCNQTTPGGGEALGISGYPAFNAPTAWSTSFLASGCNLMNLGSDHTNDKGQPAIDAMVATWSAQQGVLAHAGANRSADEQAQIRYFTVKQMKFAYLSYTTKTQKPDVTPFGINVYNDATAKQQIEEARKNANLVIVSMSWGNEDQEAISADQERIAQSLAEYGVDVVVGVGPHVLQPAKILDGEDGHQTLVWFSLGNFLNSQLPVNNLIGGMAVMDFDAATGQMIDPKLMPLYMHYEWTPQQKASGNVNARTAFKLYPLDQATEALARSQNGTTVAEQMARVTAIITKHAPIKIITSAEY